MTASRNPKAVISGACHCGVIRYRFSSPAAVADLPLRQCGCGFCTKHGARYISHPDGALESSVTEADELGRYRFGHGTADFLLCRRCGTIIAAVSRIDGRDYAVLNVNTADEAGRFAAAAELLDYDAEAPGERLERRRRNWIGQVRLVVPGPGSELLSGVP